MAPGGELKPHEARGPLNVHLGLLNEVRQSDSFKLNKLNADLRVVPVEGEPVEAFQLVFPECVGILVANGALQLLPVGWSWTILDAQDIIY